MKVGYTKFIQVYDASNLLVSGYSAYIAGNSSNSGSVLSPSDTVLYYFTADSIWVTAPDGTTSRYYGFQGDSLRIYN